MLRNGLLTPRKVLHATPSLQETLSNVRRLLKPGGKLFLQELSPVYRAINYIMVCHSSPLVAQYKIAD